MDFDLSAEQQMIKKNVADFMRKEVGPLTEAIDREDEFPPGLWEKMGDLGFLGLGIPEEYGGSGSDLFATVLATEQISRVCPAVALSYGAHVNLCAHNILRNGTEEQKMKYLPNLCSGVWYGCMGLTEPDAGSDAVGIRTTAEKDGDDYILNGSKIFITNAPVAQVAMVYAKTEPEKNARGITSFIIEKGFEGFTVPGKMKKMGNRGSATGELVFNNCRVPGSQVLGQVNNGIHVMMTGLDLERAVVAAIALGIGEAALDLAIKYSKKRHQFGQAISEFQLIKAKLADMYTEMEAARGLVYKAAIMADKARGGGKGTDVHKLAAAAVLFTGEAASRAVNQSLQIHGGYGYTLEYPINRFFRDAKLYEIGAGTSEIRRLLIANELIQRGMGDL
ncbi:MAG: acyl-CoA dehydrogenase family protein [Desulfatibacillum sp.]|nr:acyl-CoA dehydrogenase family protein [Desulfatibacillum sp.]